MIEKGKLRNASLKGQEIPNNSDLNKIKSSLARYSDSQL